MKIIIKPENENEPKETIYDNVCEFAICGYRMRGDIIYDSINHSHGDKYILIGKLEELKERLKDYGK